MRGFSLLELVITMVIAGIIAALAIPQFADTQAKAAWFTEQVRAATRYAQRQAVAQRRLMYVVVQPALVRVCYDAGCTSELSMYRLSAPNGVTVTPTTTFSFNGLGQPSSPITLTVGGNSISVVGETGYVL
ncbi:MAG: GspH/FimT family pseudopilin [Burkholderiales bacterium]